jgi:Holliday junction DNA helicase RuvB
MRTPRGRLLSEGGYRHLGVAVPSGQKHQLDLLAAGDQADEA